MKRNRNSFSYRAHYFVRNINWKSVGSIIIDVLTAIALLGFLFYGPHIFH